MAQSSRDAAIADAAKSPSDVSKAWPATRLTELTAESEKDCAAAKASPDPAIQATKTTAAAATKRTDDVATARASSVSGFEPSTNLAEVSDWLTKLPLGVGLGQLTHLGPPLASLINAAASGLGGSPSCVGGTACTSGAAQVMAGTIMVTYLGLGFLVGYVTTSSGMARTCRSSKPRRVRPAVRSRTLGPPRWG